jgi:TonB family protein
MNPALLHNIPMILSLLLLAQAATAAPPPSSQNQTPTFSAPDQVPEEAIRWGWNGTARADLTITPKGHVSACKIVQSTGHKLLDDHVCKTMLTRARFKPATDNEGKPIESHFITPPIVFKFGN